MDITEVSILHHAGLVLLVIYFLSAFNCSHMVVYFLALIYLYMVHERYVTRLQRKLQFEERKQANQRRVLSDSETVRWLNHAIENIWPICMEQIASQMVLLPIIPWFLEKYKPWTAKEAVVQHLYLGRTPPLLTEVRVLRQNNDDHLVLELGMNFLTADDMSAILAVKLRKRLGFGMWAKLHITGMHVEGKVLVGVKFLRTWPFISRLRVCFVEPPYFQMTVKPIFTHGLDVTELPGIAGWLDKLLSIAFEQTLVEPNMLVVDVEKFISPQQEPWFSMDEKDPVAYANVEVIEGSDMKPSDLNGLADPYVKGNLGAYRFRTKVQKKTLNPKWHEEFKIPIVSWESNNVLTIEVRDKDHFYDDILGDCSVNINDLRDGQRHDMWLPLENVKIGRLHLAITVLEDNEKEVDYSCDQKVVDSEERQDSFSAAASKNPLSSVSSEKQAYEKTPKVEDDYEPIDVKGQKETGIWVHHPGSEDSRTWTPRKGSRRLDTEIQGEHNGLSGDSKSTISGQGNNNDSSSNSDESSEHKHRIRRGLHKIGGVFRRGNKKDDNSGSFKEEVVPSPHDNIKSVNNNSVGVRFVMDDNISGFPTGKVEVEGGSSDGSGPDSPAKGNVKDRAKNIFRQAEKSFKQVISFKSKKNKGDLQAVVEKGSSDDESLSVQSSKDERIPVVSKPIATSSNDSPKSVPIATSSHDSPKSKPIATSSNDSPKPKVIVVQTVPSNTPVEDNEDPAKKVIVEQDDPKILSSSTDRPDEERTGGI